MPTGTYVEFQATKPVASDAITPSLDNSRTNMLALRDAGVTGGMIGWDIASITYTSSKITQIIYSKGTERLKVDIVYLSSGPANGKVDTETYRYSSDSGGSYVLMAATGFANAKRTYAYDGAGILTGATWS